MKKLKKKFFFWFFLLFIGGCGLSKEMETEVITTIEFDETHPFLGDAQELVKVLEETHPAFVTDNIPLNYEAAKKEFLEISSTKLSTEDFRFAVQKYLVSLNDGHTSIVSEDNLFLDIQWKASQENLYLLTENGKLSGKEVIAIGGISVQDIFDVVDYSYPMENKAAVEAERENGTKSRKLLLRAGCIENEDNKSMTLSIKTKDKTEEKTVFFKEGSIYDRYRSDTSISYYIEDDIFIIDFNSCDITRKLKDTAQNLREAVDGGLKKVILDVRDNPGGNSEAGKMLLNAMGIEVPSYGAVIRYSPLAKKNGRSEKISGIDRYEPDIKTAKKNENVNLIILTNENTFSSATMLAVWVKDGKLGRIVGRTSSNAPNAYGDILNYELPHSKIKVTISYKQFLRPDKNASKNEVEPDIMTEIGEDILQRAFDILKEENEEKK